MLHLTQPASTAQIKALEEELGVALFDRRPGRISLTKAGEVLLSDAEQVLGASAQLVGKARELQGEIRGHLALGTVGDWENWPQNRPCRRCIGRSKCRWCRYWRGWRTTVC